MINFTMLLLLFVINNVESGRRLIGFNFKSLSPTGHKQCLKMCIAYAECLSVNFSRNRLLCELNSQHETETDQVTVNTSETEDFIYIPRISFSKHIDVQAEMCNNVTCPIGKMCVRHSPNKTSCVIARCIQPMPQPYIGSSAELQVDLSAFTGNRKGGNVGENVYFTCPPRTVVMGSPTIKCLANGQWETRPRCQVCLEASDPSGARYWGTKSVTSTGKTCQSWSSQSPHGHSYSEYTGNYCRNNRNDNPKPWCYTTNPSVRWESCDIPNC
ncbi:prothrombin-like [Crassostrea angulata]|uniref:prothrombin-like n=1 Tax=Magallana angulata TaxID=2784310 RepID=UPI0022B1F21B|nr:prothrombin-like [Crassostrea angulata]